MNISWRWAMSSVIWQHFRWSSAASCPTSRSTARSSARKTPKASRCTSASLYSSPTRFGSFSGKSPTSTPFSWCNQTTVDFRFRAQLAPTSDHYKTSFSFVIWIFFLLFVVVGAQFCNSSLQQQSHRAELPADVFTCKACGFFLIRSWRSSSFSSMRPFLSASSMAIEPLQLVA